jgi:hypothetical protein
VVEFSISTLAHEEPVPNTVFLRLMDENTQMKLELGNKLEQLMQYKLLVEEYADKLD